MANPNTIADSGGCTCQGCGIKYTVDIVLTDALWESLSGNANLLCGACIMTRLENCSEYAAYFLTTLKSETGIHCQQRNGAT